MNIYERYIELQKNFPGCICKDKGTGIYYNIKDLPVQVAEKPEYHTMFIDTEGTE